MVNLDLAWMEWFSIALTDAWQLECTDGSFEQDYLLTEVHPSVPLCFVPAPDVIP